MSPMIGADVLLMRVYKTRRPVENKMIFICRCGRVGGIICKEGPGHELLAHVDSIAVVVYGSFNAYVDQVRRVHARIPEVRVLDQSLLNYARGVHGDAEPYTLYVEWLLGAQKNLNEALRLMGVDEPDEGPLYWPMVYARWWQVVSGGRR